jgi:hypothetical protein
MRKPLQVVVILALAAAVTVAVIKLVGRKQREEAFAEVIAYGADLERAAEPARAALVYEQGLNEDFDDAQKTQLRFRRARALIDGNDLNTAFGLLNQLMEADVARLGLDLGPMLLQLGRRARENGNDALAKLAFRLGQTASPQRYEEFGRELESFIRTPTTPTPQDSK